MRNAKSWWILSGKPYSAKSFSGPALSDCNWLYEVSHAASNHWLGLRTSDVSHSAGPLLRAKLGRSLQWRRPSRDPYLYCAGGLHDFQTDQFPLSAAGPRYAGRPEALSTPAPGLLDRKSV